MGFHLYAILCRFKYNVAWVINFLKSFSAPFVKGQVNHMHFTSLNISISDEIKRGKPVSECLSKKKHWGQEMDEMFSGNV